MDLQAIKLSTSKATLVHSTAKDQPQGRKGSITLCNDDAVAVALRLAAGAAEGTLSIFSNDKGQTMAGIWSGDRQMHINKRIETMC